MFVQEIMKFGESYDIILSYRGREICIDSSVTGDYIWYPTVWLDLWWKEDVYFALFRAGSCLTRNEQIKSIEWFIHRLPPRNVYFMTMEWWDVMFDIFIPPNWKDVLSFGERNQLQYFALIIRALVDKSNVLLNLDVVHDGEPVSVWITNFMFNLIFRRNMRMIDSHESSPFHLTTLFTFEKKWFFQGLDFPYIRNVIGAFTDLIIKSVHGNDNTSGEVSDMFFEHNFVNCFPGWCCDETIEKFAMVSVECLCHFSW